MRELFERLQNLENEPALDWVAVQSVAPRAAAPGVTLGRRNNGGSDGTRTRGLRRDRPAL